MVVRHINIIVPFVERVREHLKLGKEQAALAIFDHFRGQLTTQVTDLLEKHNIQAVLVPLIGYSLLTFQSTKPLSHF